MRIIKGILASTGILSTLLLSTPVQAQKQTNTISSCYEQTTSGVINKGKCIIRSKLKGNYVFVKIEKSWGETNYFRLSNPYCIKWHMEGINEHCVVLESSDGYNYKDTGITKFGPYQDDKGNQSLVYSYGRGYGFHYQGKFEAPIVETCQGVSEEFQTTC